MSRNQHWQTCSRSRREVQFAPESVVHAPLENEWSVNLHDTIILRGSGMTFNSSTGMPNTSLRDAKISSNTHNIYKHVSIGNRNFAVPRINFEVQQLGMRQGTSERRRVMLRRSPPPRSGSVHARRAVHSSFASHRRALRLTECRCCPGQRQPQQGMTGGPPQPPPFLRLALCGLVLGVLHGVSS
jgi:hypothetical protein